MIVLKCEKWEDVIDKYQDMFMEIYGESIESVLTEMLEILHYNFRDQLWETVESLIDESLENCKMVGYQTWTSKDRAP